MTLEDPDLDSVEDQAEEYDRDQYGGEAGSMDCVTGMPARSKRLCRRKCMPRNAPFPKG